MWTRIGGPSAKAPASKKARRIVRTIDCGVMGPFSRLALPHGLALTDLAVCGLWMKLKRRPRRQRRRCLAVAHVVYVIIEWWRSRRRRPSTLCGATFQGPPPRSPGAPLQVMSMAPSPVASRAAATATPDALASAE